MICEASIDAFVSLYKLNQFNPKTTVCEASIDAFVSLYKRFISSLYIKFLQFSNF